MIPIHVHSHCTKGFVNLMLKLFKGGVSDTIYSFLDSWSQQDKSLLVLICYLLCSDEDGCQGKILSEHREKCWWLYIHGQCVVNKVLLKGEWARTIHFHIVAVC